MLGFVGVAVMVIIGFLAAFLVGVLLAAVGATLLNVGLSGMSDADTLRRLPELFGRAMLALSMDAALGFAIATIARSQLAGIGVGSACSSSRASPGPSCPTCSSGSRSPRRPPWWRRPRARGGGGGGARLEPDIAIVVVAVWLIAALVVASLWTERAEIAG